MQNNHIDRAVWFAKLFEQFLEHKSGQGERKTINLRQMHYWAQGLGNVLMYPFKDKKKDLYINDDKSNSDLITSSRYARVLGLVDPSLFTDLYNPDPILYAEDKSELDFVCDIHLPQLDSPEINLAIDTIDKMSPFVDVQHPVSLYGPAYKNYRAYRYDTQQPYYVEVWIEKTTMNDILDPICKKYHVNLIPLNGMASSLAVTDFLKRTEEITTPIRILYISDFDPNGEFMPITVARKIEHELMRRGLTHDIKLEPILLNLEQRTQYELPATPLKKDRKDKRDDRGIAAFESTYGEDVAAELDALEAKYPGEFERIVTEHILQYYDKNLVHNYEEFVYDLETEWIEKCADVLKPYNERIEKINSKIEDIEALYEDKIYELQSDLEEELAPFRDEIMEMREELTERLRVLRNEIEIETDISPPEPELNPCDDNWLYDSSRDFIRQWLIFKERRPK
jgi:hypothetical protein